MSGRDRFVYCKNGSVADELATLEADPGRGTKGGPYHYIATFLKWSTGAQVLLLSYDEQPKAYRSGSVQAHVLLRRQRRWRLTATLQKIRIFASTFARVMAFRPTWVFCAASGPALWACFLAARIYGAPIVHTRHNRLERAAGGVAAWETRVNAAVIRHVSAAIAHGPFLAQELAATGIPAARLREFNLNYRHLLAPPKANKATPDLTREGTRTVLLFMGRLVEDKGIFDLLTALAARLREDSSLCLAYAGDGPARERLAADVQALGLGDQVALLGHLEERMLHAVVQQARAVILPTRRRLPEGRCKAANEALVLGTPVIAPALRPFTDLIVHERNGLLYEPESVPALAQALYRVLDDEALDETLRTEGTEYSHRLLLDPPLTFEAALEWAYQGSQGELASA
ncbi:glycosyltransferase family 4 protein [Ectothiorhodospiraceae bacterium 2226]|nr:glycosyltransferase family 4 protein [Ectothiorhodospiraceae bacterium 2226]